MSATPIDPQDIRVGDVVRCINEFEVTTASSYIEDTVHCYALGREGRTWELVSRPEPPREPGSLWYDTCTGAAYIRTDSQEAGSDLYRRFIRGGEDAPDFLDGRAPLDLLIIARLVPWAKP